MLSLRALIHGQRPAVPNEFAVILGEWSNMNRGLRVTFSEKPPVNIRRSIVGCQSLEHRSDHQMEVLQMFRARAFNVDSGLLAV